jgi:hypothetical protein
VIKFGCLKNDFRCVAAIKTDGEKEEEKPLQGVIAGDCISAARSISRGPITRQRLGTCMRYEMKDEDDGALAMVHS